MHVIGIEDVEVIAAGGAKAVELGAADREVVLAPLRAHVDARNATAA